MTQPILYIYRNINEEYMEITGIERLKNALIKQGVPVWQINNMSEEQLRLLCNQKLCESLTGNKHSEKIDTYSKKYKYNIIYKLPDKTQINVAKVAETLLKSGRKIETFVDIAGNQYFQYRAADNKILNENYFRKKENIKIYEKIKYLNGKIYKIDFWNNLIPINTSQIPFDINKRPIKPNENVFNINKATQELIHLPIDEDIIITKEGNVDLCVFSINYLLTKYDDKSYKLIQKRNPTNKFDKTITVYNKDSNEHVCTISYNKERTQIEYPDNMQYIVKNDVLTKYFNIPNSGTLIGEYKGNNFKIKYIDKNKKIIYTETGIIGKEDESEINAPYIKNLHSELCSINIYGYKQITQNAIDIILKNINKNNYFTINYIYEKLYGKKVEMIHCSALAMA